MSSLVQRFTQTSFFALALSLSPMASAQVFGEVFGTSSSSWLSDQWQKLKVQTDITKDATIGKYTTGRVRYEYKVEPAFINGAQQRQDAWTAELEANGSPFNLASELPVNAHGKIGAQVIFSRLFAEKNDAMKSIPYWLDRIPWDAGRAIESLSPGDAVRIQIFLDASVGLSRSGIADSWTLGTSLTHQRGTLFLVDIYRLKNNRVRVKIVGQRNLGTNTFGLDISPTDRMDMGTGIIKEAISRWINCSIVGGDLTRSDFKEPPVDTFMVDFAFNLNNEKGVQAYNAMMNEIAHIRYQEALNPKLIYASKEDVTSFVFEEIKKITQAPEALFQTDKNLLASERGVERIFKGKTRSAISGGSVHSRCIRVWDMRGYTTKSTTLVENSDRSERTTYHIYDTYGVGSEKAAIGSIFETNKRSTISSLYTTDQDYNPAVVTDFILNRSIQDKSYGQSELNELKDFLKYILPVQTYSELDWSGFEAGSSSKTNASMQFEIVLRDNAFKAFPVLSAAQVYERLYSFVENFPDRRWLTPTVSPNESENGRSNYPMAKFENDITNISQLFGKMMNADLDLGQRLQTARLLRDNALFQQIGVGFLVSLLPKDQAAELISFKLDLSAANTPKLSYNNHRGGSSATYTSAQYIINLIQDRTFDLKLQINEASQLLSSPAKKDLK